MENEVRIVERVLVNGDKIYVIQQRHFLFKWVWVDGYEQRFAGWFFSYHGRYKHKTLKDAIDNVCYFDGSKPKNTVVWRNK